VLLKEQGYCIVNMQMSSICNTYADPYIRAWDTLWICGSIHKRKLGLLACIPVFVATLRCSLLSFYSSLNRFPRISSGVNSFVRADLCNVNIFEPDSSSGCTAHNS